MGEGQGRTLIISGLRIPAAFTYTCVGMLDEINQNKCRFRAQCLQIHVHPDRNRNQNRTNAVRSTTRDASQGRQTGHNGVAAPMGGLNQLLAKEAGSHMTSPSTDNQRSQGIGTARAHPHARIQAPAGARLPLYTGPGYGSPADDDDRRGPPLCITSSVNPSEKP